MDQEGGRNVCHPHVPFEQVPEQHCAADVHSAPAATQPHAPLVHVPEQQSWATWHGFPALGSHWQKPLEQAPEQQVEPSVQAAPAPAHAHEPC